MSAEGNEKNEKIKVETEGSSEGATNNSDEQYQEHVFLAPAPYSYPASRTSTSSSSSLPPLSSFFPSRPHSSTSSSSLSNSLQPPANFPNAYTLPISPHFRHSSSAPPPGVGTPSVPFPFNTSTGLVGRAPFQDPKFEHSLLFDCLRGENRDVQTHALDLRTNLGNQSHSHVTGRTTHDSSGSLECQYCEWCKEKIRQRNCANPSFCRDICFESYRRSHYKKRTCCALCGGKGDWDLSGESFDASTTNLREIPERLCQYCRQQGLANVRVEMEHPSRVNLNSEVSQESRSQLTQTSEQTRHRHVHSVLPQLPAMRPGPVPMSSQTFFNSFMGPSTANNLNIRQMLRTNLITTSTPTSARSRKYSVGGSTCTMTSAPASQSSSSSSTLTPETYMQQSSSSVQTAPIDNQVPCMPANSLASSSISLIPLNSRQTKSVYQSDNNHTMGSASTTSSSAMNSSNLEMVPSPPSQHSEEQSGMERLTLRRASPGPPPIESMQQSTPENQDGYAVPPPPPVSPQTAAAFAAANTLVTMTIPKNASGIKRGINGNEIQCDDTPQLQGTSPPTTTTPQSHSSAFVRVKVSPQPTSCDYLPQPCCCTDSSSSITLTPLPPPPPLVSGEIKTEPISSQQQQHQEDDAQPESSFHGYQQHAGDQALQFPQQRSDFQHHSQQQFLQQSLLARQQLQPPLPPRLQPNCDQQQHSSIHNIMYGAPLSIDIPGSNRQQNAEICKRVRLDTSGEDTVQRRISNQPPRPLSTSQAPMPLFPPHFQDTMYPASAFQHQQRCRYPSQQQQLHAHPLMANHLQQQQTSHLNHQQQLNHFNQHQYQPHSHGMTQQWPSWGANSHSHGTPMEYSRGGAVGINNYNSTTRQSCGIPVANNNDSLHSSRGGFNPTGGGYTYPTRDARRDIPRNINRPFHYPPHPYYLPRSIGNIASRLPPTQPPHRRPVPSATVTSATAAVSGTSHQDRSQLSNSSGVIERLLQASNSVVPNETSLSGIHGTAPSSRERDNGGNRQPVTRSMLMGGGANAVSNVSSPSLPTSSSGGAGSSYVMFFETAGTNRHNTDSDIVQRTQDRPSTSGRGRGGRGRGRGGRPPRHGSASRKPDNDKKHKATKFRGDQPTSTPGKPRGRGGWKILKEETITSVNSFFTGGPVANSMPLNQAGPILGTLSSTSVGSEPSGLSHDMEPALSAPFPQSGPTVNNVDSLAPTPLLPTPRPQQNSSPSIFPGVSRPAEVQSTLPTVPPTPQGSSNPGEGQTERKQSLGLANTPYPIAIPLFFPVPIFIPIPACACKAALKEIHRELNSTPKEQHKKESSSETVQCPQPEDPQGDYTPGSDAEIDHAIRLSQVEYRLEPSEPTEKNPDQVAFGKRRETEAEKSNNSGDNQSRLEDLATDTVQSPASVAPFAAATAAHIPFNDNVSPPVGNVNPHQHVPPQPTNASPSLSAPLVLIASPSTQAPVQAQVRIAPPTFQFPLPITLNNSHPSPCAGSSQDVPQLPNGSSCCSVTNPARNPIDRQLQALFLKMEMSSPSPQRENYQHSPPVDVGDEVEVSDQQDEQQRWEQQLPLAHLVEDQGEEENGFGDLHIAEDVPIVGENTVDNDNNNSKSDACEQESVNACHTAQ